MPFIYNRISSIIYRDPNIHKGEWLFKGTRIPVRYILKHFSMGGWTVNDLSNEYPDLKKSYLRKLFIEIANEFRSKDSDHV